jgi:hypothetical protein
MDADAQREWFWLTDEQHGVIAKKQVDDVGIGRGSLDHLLRSGKWRRLHRGVYAAFTGEPTREARLWAAVLRAGQGAVLSHETAAELQHLADRPSSTIHVTVPASRRPAQNKPIPGVVIHRSRHIRPQELPQWDLPRTRIEDTVLDLAGAAATFEDAYDWISRAVSRQYTTAGLLRDAVGERKRMRWRKWLDGALADITGGVYFHVEWHYGKDVELAHGLPKGVRQASRVIDGEKHLKDVLYDDRGLCVELDGRICHGDKRAAKDVRTLRFGHVDVTERACTTAALVAAALHGAGWDGTPRPCRRTDCTAVRDYESFTGAGTAV